jgi:hypothetical protein
VPLARGDALVDLERALFGDEQHDRRAWAMRIDPCYKQTNAPASAAQTRPTADKCARRRAARRAWKLDIATRDLEDGIPAQSGRAVNGRLSVPAQMWAG